VCVFRAGFLLLLCFESSFQSFFSSCMLFLYFSCSRSVGFRFAFSFLLSLFL
jgi:hypothetical protein